MANLILGETSFIVRFRIQGKEKHKIQLKYKRDYSAIL